MTEETIVQNYNALTQIAKSQHDTIVEQDRHISAYRKEHGTHVCDRDCWACPWFSPNTVDKVNSLLFSVVTMWDQHDKRPDDHEWQEMNTIIEAAREHLKMEHP